MYHLGWILNIKLLITLSSLTDVLCSIDGTFRPRKWNSTKPLDDVCNPLYWYPKNIPEYCFFKKEMTVKPPRNEPPMPMPLPALVPPIAIPVPFPVPPPVLPPMFSHPIPYPLPFGIPIAPTNPMMPVAFGFAPQALMPPIYSQAPPIAAVSQPLLPSPVVGPPPMIPPFMPNLPPYGLQRKPMSMVPGLPGLVSPDGGINIMPFSDAYADLLEKHKQKMIRKRLQNVLDEYDGFSSRKSEEDTKHYDIS